MSIDSLPYMVFLLLVEFTAGALVVTYVAQMRGLVPHGFVKMGAGTALCGAALATWMATTLGRPSDVGGYRLDETFLNPSRIALWSLLALLVLYTFVVWRERAPAASIIGLAASAAALVSLGLVAAIIRLPAWGYPGVVLSLLAGALSLGSVTMGMVLGHWYLVSPRLPEQPLNEITLALIVVLAVQSALVLINLFIPVRQTPSAVLSGSGIIQDAAFWLRIGVGLVFPIALAVMAWRSSLVRGMMSATGLLYVATGAVLAGEALARGLQLATAIPF
ncbi:MAG TPA: hypothetical protein VIO16_10155 [Dehalococcoidia bacterium]